MDYGKVALEREARWESRGYGTLKVFARNLERRYRNTTVHKPDPILSRAWWRTKVFRLLERMTLGKNNGSTKWVRRPDFILVLAPVLRGDYIVLSPLLKAIRHAMPATYIVVVASRASYEVAKYDLYADEVILYRKLPGWFASMWRIMNYKADVVILPKGHPAFTESMLMAVSPAKVRIGLSHPGHDSLLTHPISHHDYEEHRVVTILRLLEPLRIKIDADHSTLHIGKDDAAETAARQLIEEWGAEDPWISINLSAGAEPKLWAPEKWEELLGRLIVRLPDVKYICLGAPTERWLCDRLEERFMEVFSIYTLSLVEAAAYIARTKLLISPDTGAVHAAAARRVPVVALYNGWRENYDRFAPWGVDHLAIEAKEGQPTSTILVDDVFEAVEEMLSYLT